MSRYVPPTVKRSQRKPKSELLSTAEAAAYLGVCERTIRSWRDRGLIDATRIGPRLWKYLPAELDKVKQRASA
ncbi:helix-turn-helix domain-containing protein [Mycobacterium avium]|nr:helix-turn-helix domain-containing protein [Mycobacterium avium]MCA4732159.1 helix-turn-helix domain-containing protein [Mycobacterium avium subsp. hominissuis]MDO2360998.1 helix-turn-helix domain-containing protein [Mycobacterium avium subsp. hominissuis]UBV03751.1 helix-turn-helix domain-containing protein [Mycobacterium avium subsp. hominissuis]